jgi:hypothetical protein
MNEKLPLLRVRDWAHRFENSRTRELRSLAWLPVPTDLSSDVYTRILDHTSGAAHFGVSIGLYIIASKSSPRGDLRRENGLPHDAQSLARVLRMPQELVEGAIKRLVEIADIEVVNGKARRIKSPAWRRDATIRQKGATSPQDAATPRQLSAAEGKGTEGKESSSSEGKEEKGIETPEGNDWTGTEPRARESAAGDNPRPQPQPPFLIETLMMMIQPRNRSFSDCLSSSAKS